jgi:uncharacterized protein (DUF2141 family)
MGDYTSKTVSDMNGADRLNTVFLGVVTEAPQDIRNFFRG